MQLFKIPRHVSNVSATANAVRASTSEPRPLRAVSNLKADPRFQLSPKAKVSGGMYFYNNKFKGKLKMPELLFLSLISQVLFPEIPQKATVPFIRYKFKPLLDLVAKDWTKSGIGALVSIRKDEEKKRFIATIPGMAIRREGNPYGLAKAALLACGDNQAVNKSEFNFPALEKRAETVGQSGGRYLLSDLKASGNVSDLFANEAKAIGVSLIIKPTAEYDMIFLEVPFSKEECESMCNADWITIRPLDMYGMINAWVGNYYGRRGRSPTYSIPLSDIAKESDSKTSIPRLSKEGIMLDEDGEMYALPATLNNIYAYEDATNSAMTHDDGSFSPISPSGERKPMTPAMPVYLDWVNLKFAYTSLEGRLLVMNLDRSQPLTITHTRKFLETRLEDPVAMHFISIALNMAKFTGLMSDEPTLFYKSLVKEVEKLGLERESYQNAAEIPLVCIADYSVDSGDAEGAPSPAGSHCKKFVAMMHQLKKFITDNPTNAYARYSVTTVLSLVAQVTVFTEFGTKYSEVITEDNTKRHAYMNQGVTPDFKLAPVPLIEPKRGLLPHQNKVQNILRDRPDNAILPVDAGGGKCLVGTSLIPTSKGLLTLAELREMSGKTIARGFKELSGVDVITTAGLKDAAATYVCTGETHEVQLADGTVFEGIPKHKIWDGKKFVRLDKLDVGHWIPRYVQTSLFPKSLVKLNNSAEAFVDFDYVPTPNETRKYLNKNTVRSSTAVHFVTDGYKLPSYLNEDLAVILGYLISEGCISERDGDTSVGFTNHDKEVMDDFIQKVYNVFKIALTPGKKTVGISNKIASLFLRSLDIKGTAQYKFVPQVIRQSPKHIQSAFLRALFEGDGAVFHEFTNESKGHKKSILQYYTISKTLAYQVKAMLETFGFSPKLKHGSSYKSRNGNAHLGNKTTVRHCYTLSVHATEHEKFQEEIGFISKRKTSELSRAVAQTKQAADPAQNQQVTNFKVHGWVNQVPAVVQMQTVVDRVSSILSSTPVTQTKIDRYGNKCEYTTYIKGFKNLFHFTGIPTAPYLRLTANAKKLDLNYVTKYAIERLPQLLKAIPFKELRKLILEDKIIADALSEMKEMAKFTWSYVTKSEPTGRVEYCYDLSVPEQPEYVANGYMSHNTSLIVYEILREISENDGQQGLCLCLCPSHLVAQYVKEFAYFTGARVNVIPVTSYTIRRQGYERLEAMIRNAPPNTVIVTDYNAILLSNNSMAYGSSVVKTFPVIEFLRQFVFKYVACDESHWLKNGSSRTAAVNRLIVDIKRKRLASGTLVANVLNDLVRQAALLDPTIFGTEAQFLDKYALEVRGSKVIRWKPGAELAIKRQLGSHVVMAEAKRKEWAAILPFPIIKFHPCQLTPKQQEAYHEILQQVIAVILEKAKDNKVLAELLSGKTDPDELGADLDALLKPYLARLERFITAPGKDAYGGTVLEGEDLVSPKIHVINQIIKEHLESGAAGKVLIFTNYELSTDAIWEGLAMGGLQDQAIYYTAADKEECGAEFEKNPKKKILVGIEQSLNTGLNLQFCSVLIRVESVWTPGAMEQGNSRIGRPNIKVREERKEIFYHTIAANRTIDVTKISYLMAKTIVKAKFDEAGNPRFDDLEAPPLLAMTLDNIASENDWDSSLMDYFLKFRELQRATAEEYAEYRQNNQDILFDAAGNLKIEVLERAPNPQGVALMRRIPYVPGTELYKSDDLGLLRYDDYIAKHHKLKIEEDDEEINLGDDEEGGGDDDREVSEKKLSADKLAALEEERALCVGMAVHTDFGDGEIRSVGTKTLSVRLPSGELIKVRKLSAFIITRANTSGKDIRNQLLKLTGDVPIDSPIDVLEVDIDPRIEKAVSKQLEKDKKKAVNEVISMKLAFTVANDFLGIALLNLDDDRAVKVAQGAGFKFTPAYYAAEVKNPKQMLDFFRILRDKGFSVDKAGNNACHDAYQHFKANRKNTNLFYGYAASSAIRNFFRIEFKPKADKMFVSPYPLVQGDKLYICLPKTGHPGSLNAIRKTASGAQLRWLIYEESSEMINFVGSKPSASSVIHKLLGMGVVISNVKTLKTEFKALRMVKRKDSEL